MRRITRSACLGAAVLFLGCTADLPLQSPPPETDGSLDAYRAFTANLAATSRSYLARAKLGNRRINAERNASLLEMIDHFDGEARADHPQGFRADESYVEVDRPGHFDLGGTFTSVLLEYTLPSVASFTRVDIPAILEQDVSGNVTSNGMTFTLSRHASTFPIPTIGFADEININEVDCSAAPANVTAATDHSAGWHVKGFGWIPLHTRTSDYASCSGNCRYTFERTESAGSAVYALDGYDPYDAYSTTSTPSGCDGGGGTGGSGGGDGDGGAECRSEWVIIEISHDGGGTWETYWEGYADVCG